MTNHIQITVLEENSSL